MKKLLALILCFVMAFGALASCADDHEDSGTSSDKTENVTSAVEDTSKEAETEPEPEPDVLSDKTGFWYEAGKYDRELVVDSIEDDTVYFNYEVYEEFGLRGASAKLDGDTATFEATTYGDEPFDVSGSLIFGEDSVTLEIAQSENTVYIPVGAVVFSEKYAVSQMFPEETPAWVQAYSDYVFLDGENVDFDDIGTLYSLIYVDDDSIPEMLVTFSYEAAGTLLLTFDGERASGKTIGRIGGVKYIDRGGLLKMSNGHMGYFYDMVYRIENGTAENIGGGNYTVTFDGDGENEIYTYYWGDDEIGEDEYNENLAALFDDSLSVTPYDSYRFDKLSMREYFERFGAAVTEHTEPEGEPVAPYFASVTMPEVTLREGPGTDHPAAGVAKYGEIFKIIAESDGEGSYRGWGKIDDENGWWLPLDDTETFGQGGLADDGPGDDLN